MQSTPHRIRKQRWMVRTASAPEAFAWRRFLREQGQDLLLPLLERVFEEAAGLERVVHIPRLELKVRVDSVERLAEVLPELALQQLREQLGPILQEQAPLAGQPVAWEESPTPINRFELLLYYLRRGSLPWPAAHGSASQQALAFTETCRREWRQLLDYLRSRPESAPFYFRLLQFLSPEEAVSLVEALSGAGPPGFGAALAHGLRQLLDPGKSPFRRYTRLRLAAAFLAEAVLGRAGTRPPNLGDVAVEAVPPEEQRVWQEFLSKLPEAAAVWFQPRKPEPILDEAGKAETRTGDRDLDLRPKAGSASSPRSAGAVSAEAQRERQALDSATPGPGVGQVVKTSAAKLEAPGVEPILDGAGEAETRTGDRDLDLRPKAEPTSSPDSAGAVPAEARRDRYARGSATPGPGVGEAVKTSAAKPEAPGVEPISDQAGEAETRKASRDLRMRLKIRPSTSPRPAKPKELQVPQDADSPAGGRPPKAEASKAPLEAPGAQAQASTFPTPAAEPLEHPPSTEALFPLLVQQAGLVLLHPFLPRFLENTAILEKGHAQLTASALGRAAALLYLLATGREEFYEYELGLIKVMLGLHPEFPLPVCAGLVKPEDGEEAEALLQSAIGHWGALKNTSVSGLRSAFLERQGLLREEGDLWKLQVERGPFDVLLDQLPWSISIVRLPWMRKAIYTEW